MQTKRKFTIGQEVVFLQRKRGEVQPIAATLLNIFRGLPGRPDLFRITYQGQKKKVTVNVKACNVVNK